MVKILVREPEDWELLKLCPTCFTRWVFFEATYEKCWWQGWCCLNCGVVFDMGGMSDTNVVLSDKQTWGKLLELVYL